MQWIVTLICVDRRVEDHLLMDLILS